MNYPPQHHQEHNFANAIKIIKTYPLATLITSKNDEVYSTHLPMIHEADGSTYGKLVAHIDKFNPQVNSLSEGDRVQIIFHGPDTYISPSIYKSTQLPTWNYLKVHLKGIVKRYHDREVIKQSIIRMTEFLEGDDQKYILHPENKSMERALDYIDGFEVEITEWEGKFKFSQDKQPIDKELAKKQLIKNAQKDVTTLIDDIFENHNK